MPKQRPALPSEAVLVVSAAREAALPSVLANLYASADPVVLLTDDRDELGTIPSGLTVVEPEELLDRGVCDVEEVWDAAVRRWLERMFPGTLDGFALWELLWSGTFRQHSLVDRISSVALAAALLRSLRVRAVHLVGPAPPYCELVGAAARRRGIRVIERSRLRTPRAARIALWPLGVAAASGLMVLDAARAVRRMLARREVMYEVRALAGSVDAATEPSLWIALTGSWPQSSRHVRSAVIEPCLDRGVPFGLAFEITCGEPSDGPWGKVDERSLFDGHIARYRPAAVDQIVGPTRVSELLQALIEWLPHSLRCSWRVLPACDSLEVEGIPASRLFDARGLLRVATNDLLRIVEAKHATERWLRAHPHARTVVFALSANGESKIADLIMQRAGLTTIDYLHGHVGESDLRTTFRSTSSYLAAWTHQELVRFRKLGTNRHYAGGFMPPARAMERVRQPRPRILVATSYLPRGPRTIQRRNLKHARRMAAVIVELAAHFRDRAEIVLRPHPYEERDLWTRLFSTGTTPIFSDERMLTDDLARANIVVVTNSSAAIEALEYGIPVFFPAGPIVEPESLVAQAAEERTFANGAELAEKIERVLAHPDLGPERRLQEACFGPTRRPRPILVLLEEVDPGIRPFLTVQARRGS